MRVVVLFAHIAVSLVLRVSVSEWYGTVVWTYEKGLEGMLAEASVQKETEMGTSTLSI
jgi:hypothetical protein